MVTISNELFIGLAIGISVGALIAVILYFLRKQEGGLVLERTESGYLILPIPRVTG